MLIRYEKSFKKQYKKLPKKIQAQFFERFKIFLINPNTQSLNNHKLKGKYKDFRSINISGDYRALYYEDVGVVHFTFVGTHSQLYN